MGMFVGLDGGGSSCRVQAVDAKGEVLFAGQSGSANLVSTPAPRLRRHLEAATEGLRGATHVCGCFAGLIDEPRRRVALDLMRDLFPGAVLRAEPDYVAALFAAPEGSRATVIAGTGSLVCSQGQSGIVKSGGSGYLLGDEGSGYRYGRAAARAYVRNPEADYPHLRPAMDALFRTTEAGEIVAALHRAPAPAALLAKLAKPLAQDHRAGAPYAEPIFRHESVGLATVIADHLTLHGIPLDARICLAGGLWKSGRVFELSLADAYRTITGTDAEFVRIERPPVAGAVHLARRLATA